MKKYIGLTALVFMFTTQVYAYPVWESTECNDAKGGTIVTVGGDSFCKANSTMKWWSAYAWCDAMGGRMPTILELCPDAPSLTEEVSCGRSYPTSTPNVHSSTPSGSQTVWALGWYGTKISSNGSRSSSYTFYCLKK